MDARGNVHNSNVLTVCPKMKMPELACKLLLLWMLKVWLKCDSVRTERNGAFFNKTSLDLSTLNRLFTPQTVMRTSKGGKYTCMRNLHHFRLNIISSHLKKCLSDWRKFYIELSWAYSEVDLLDVVHPCKITHVRVALQKHFCEFN